MTHDDAFMQAIVENPDDDTPRLIYADWLEEHGEESRARFIRLQIEAARLPLGDTRREEMERQAGPLTPSIFVDEAKKIPQPWARSLPPEMRKLALGFHRGFIAVATMKGAECCWFGESFFRATPLQHIRLLDVSRRWRDVLEMPDLPRLRSLTVNGSSHRTDSVNLKNNGIVQLAAAEGLHGLKALLLWNVRCGRTGAEALADSQSLTHLTELELVYGYLAPGGMNALLTAPFFPNLIRLNLAGHRLNVDDLIRLLNSPTFPCLRVLNLHGCDLTDEAVAALAASPKLYGLVALNLGDNRITADGIRSLCASPHLGQLNSLYLNDNPLGDTGLLALLQTHLVRRLKTLNLFNIGETPEGLRAIVEADLDNLDSLTLRRTYGARNSAIASLSARFGSRFTLEYP